MDYRNIENKGFLTMTRINPSLLLKTPFGVLKRNFVYKLHDRHYHSNNDVIALRPIFFPQRSTWVCHCALTV